MSSLSASSFGASGAASSLVWVAALVITAASALAARGLGVMVTGLTVNRRAGRRPAPSGIRVWDDPGTDLVSWQTFNHPGRFDPRKLYLGKGRQGEQDPVINTYYRLL